MSELPLFPELIEQVADAPVNPCGYPYFILAYWPHGHYWSIKHPLEGEEVDDRMRAKIKVLHAAGWRHITIFRLPNSGPWART